MTIKELLDEGRVDDATARLEAIVAANSDDLAARAGLFELLVITGAFDRAAEQLDAITRIDDRPEATTGVRVFQALLNAERARQGLPDTPIEPRFLTEPSELLLGHKEANEACRRGAHVEARASLDRVQATATENLTEEEAASASGGVGIRDADDLLAPVLEVYTSEGYFWVPWDSVQFLQTRAPVSLRDLIWIQARLATVEGWLGEVYLPNLYPGTFRHADPEVKLGRVTVWDEVGSGIVRASGQKLCMIDGELVPLLAVGDARFSSREGTDSTRTTDL